MKKLTLFVLAILLTGCFHEEIPDYFSHDECYHYFYQQLSQDDQEIYTNVYNHILNFDDCFDVATNDIDHITSLIYYVFQDHPEIFYIDEWSLTGYEEDDEGELELNYTMEEEEVSSFLEQLDKKTEEILVNVEGMDQVQTITYLYRYVVENVEYVDGSKYNQEVLSAMLYGQSVCSGYAKMMQYLLNECDIPCSYLTGDSVEDESVKHAWNMVNINDDYYYLDTTWADQSIILYDYLLFDSEDMLKLYYPDDPYQNTINNQLQYHIYNDYYLDSYSQNKIAEIIKKQEGNTLTLRLESSIYQTVLKRLIDNYEIYDILESIGYYVDQIEYINHDEMNTIYIEW